MTDQSGMVREGVDRIAAHGMPAASTLTRSSAAADWMRDSCAYYTLRAGERCRQPRSCFDCLNLPVAAEPKGCVVSPYGACESMDAYSSGMNFRHNDSSVDKGEIGTPVGSRWHTFSSVNSTYCETQDPACVRCREIAVNASRANSDMASTSKFCVGADGCVCIVGCEAPTWQNHVQPDCRTANASPTVTAASTTPAVTNVSGPLAPDNGAYQLFWYLAIAQLPLFVMVLTIRARWLRFRRRKRPSPTHQLELSGWRAMNEQLVARDQHRSPYGESILHSALPPLVPSAVDEVARPPLMTRTERAVWGASSSSTSAARHNAADDVVT